MSIYITQTDRSASSCFPFLLFPLPRLWQVVLSNLFTGVRLSSAREMSLTLLHEREALPGTMEAHVPPMDVKTFQLSW